MRKAIVQHIKMVALLAGFASLGACVRQLPAQEGLHRYHGPYKQLVAETAEDQALWNRLHRAAVLVTYVGRQGHLSLPAQSVFVPLTTHVSAHMRTERLLNDLVAYLNQQSIDTLKISGFSSNPSKTPDQALVHAQAESMVALLEDHGLDARLVYVSAANHNAYHLNNPGQKGYGQIDMVFNRG